METYGKQTVIIKTVLLNMASYYKVGFSWLSKSTPSVDKTVTLLKWCKFLENIAQGLSILCTCF